jgi:hypothetical protein
VEYWHEMGGNLDRYPRSMLACVDREHVKPARASVRKVIQAPFIDAVTLAHAN